MVRFGDWLIRPLGFFVVSAAVFLLFGKHDSRAASPQEQPLRGAAALDKASDYVAEAMQREMYGLADEREELLQAASRLAPELPSARWQQGMLRNQRNQWQSVDDMIADPLWQNRLARYDRKRSEFIDTPNEQFALANWCIDEKLPLQARGHLERVIELDPNHAAARRMLGYQNIAGRWTTVDELQAEDRERADRTASVQKYRATLQKIVAKMHRGSQLQRDSAKAELFSIRDVDAVYAVEQIVSTGGPALATIAVEWLAQLTEGTITSDSRKPKNGSNERSRLVFQSIVTQSLARHAVMHDSLFVREQAANALRDRDMHSYVPTLLGSMSTPIKAEWAVIPLQGGRIGTQQVFVRETQDRREVALLQADFRRQPNSANQRLSEVERNAITDEAVRRTQAQIAEELSENLTAVEEQNRITKEINDRICWVLAVATQQKLEASPTAWWDWWTKHNELLVATEKPTMWSQDYQQNVIVDSQLPTQGPQLVTPTSIERLERPTNTQVRRIAGTPGTGRFDCLVAGTPVWTASGPVAIEKIRIGDLVYAQDPITGELALRPAIRATKRPAGPLVTIEVEGQTISCSGGHVFWVCGEGWRKASQLSSGMVLHSMNGPVRVSVVDAKGNAETFNLIVADFHSYFVGESRILSHDLTMRRPASTLIPGLARP